MKCHYLSEYALRFKFSAVININSQLVNFISFWKTHVPDCNLMLVFAILFANILEPIYWRFSKKQFIWVYLFVLQFTVHPQLLVTL